MGYTLNTMEKPFVHKDHGGVKDKEPRTVLEPYIYIYIHGPSQGPRAKHTKYTKQNDFALQAFAMHRRACMPSFSIKRAGASHASPWCMYVKPHGAMAQTCMLYIYKIKKTKTLCVLVQKFSRHHSLLQAIQSRQANKNLHSLEVLLLLGIVFQRPFGVLRILISSGDP